VPLFPRTRSLCVSRPIPVTRATLSTARMLQRASAVLVEGRGGLLAHPCSHLVSVGEDVIEEGVLVLVSVGEVAIEEGVLHASLV
jgi:dethiobiotin synthetase